MTYDQEVEQFNNVIANHYEEYQRKLRQWCFLNATTFDEDVLQDTYAKCVDRISRVGIKDASEQGCLNYFFTAFKKNTYQAHLQTTKKQIDANVDPFELILEDENTTTLEEYRHQSTDLLVQSILQEIRNNFSEIDYHIFRLRYLFQIDGKFLNYKQIKAITKIPDTRKRLMAMNAHVRTVFSKDKIKEIKRQIHI